METEKDPKEWLKKAEEDYGFASSILPETNYYAQVCFHFQQAAEKYLKAYIVKKNLEFRKIHDLHQLLNLCQKEEVGFASLKEAADFLSPFYIDARYPVHWPSAVSKEEALKARNAALEIKQFVDSKIK